VNVYTPSRYDERVIHLALGIEPRSAVVGSRLDGGVDVRWERYPRPVASWRRWYPGDTLTAALPRLDRHPSGRFARRYDQSIATEMDVRVVDDDHHGRIRVPGRGRRIVPRRLRITIADEQTVLDAEADPATPPHDAWRRMFPVACFAGSAADLPSGSTVLRGTLRRDRGDGTLVPVKWARVRADTVAGAEVGWAHGDDRGEFVLVVPATDGINLAADPMLVRLTVGAALPPPTPDPADPLLHEVDPLWDLPLEPVVASPDPANEPTLNGRRFLLEHTQLSPLSPVTPIPLHHGRQTSVVIQIT
jgi:hypothetical protein